MRKSGGVAARPRQGRDEASTDRIRCLREDDRYGSGRLQQQRHDLAASGQDDIWCEREQFRRVSANALGIARGPASVDLHVAAVDPAQLLQPLQECGEAGLPFHIVRGERHEHADAPHAVRWLRARRERPCRSRCAAEQRYERAPFHSITSSARTSSVGGIVRPRVFAVFALMTSSNLVGCSTGRSPGCSPLKILSMNRAN